LGSYTMLIGRAFSMSVPTPDHASALTGTLEMKDIRSDALLSRGVIGATTKQLAAGMLLVMTQVNFVHFLLRELAQAFVAADSLSFFKIRFGCAYHAISSLMALQGVMRSRGIAGKKCDTIDGVLGNPDAKWIRDQSRLRNMLTHYRSRIPASQQSTGRGFRETVETLSRGRTYSEVSDVSDRCLHLVSRALTAGFDLSPNTFWYARVK